MALSRTAEAKLLSLHTELEDAGRDDFSLRLSELVREVRCASTEEINVTSWDDFSRFWERNRGEQLVFILIDQFGPEHPIVTKVKELVTEATEFDRKLHDLYMQMKGKGGKKEDGEESKENDGGDDTVKALKDLEDSA